MSRTLVVLLEGLESALAWLNLPFAYQKWAPHWLYTVGFVPWSWVLAPSKWAERHGLYDMRTGRWGHRQDH